MNDLFADAEKVAEACSANDNASLAVEVELLKVVSAQDVEDDGKAACASPRAWPPNGSSRWSTPRPATATAPDGTATTAYKLHVSVDVTSDLFVAGAATKATAGDAGVLPALLEADPMAVAEVIADTHYGDAETRKALAAKGIELVAPAPPASARNGFFNKDAFEVDLAAGTVTCPAGQVAIIAGKARRREARFGASTCQVCPLASRCTKRPGGRVVTISPNEALLAEAGKPGGAPGSASATANGRKSSARTPSLKSRSSKLPWRGVAKADAWLKLRMAALNLDRLGKMPGLIY